MVDHDEMRAALCRAIEHDRRNGNLLITLFPPLDELDQEISDLVLGSAMFPATQPSEEHSDQQKENYSPA